MKIIGVIGLGSIGMRHTKNLKAMGYNVIGSDPDDSIIKNAQYDNNILVFRSPNVVMSEAEAIVIASPTTDHGGRLQQAIAFGKPVFVEKPIGHEIRTGMAAVSMVGYNLRFHPCVKEARKWLDAEHIGRPIWANFTCAQYNDKAAYRRDGVILNWSHEIDLALYLLGPAVVSASSTKLEGGQDVMTDIFLTHENGCRSSIHLDYLTEPEYRGFVIGGRRGTIKANLVKRQARVNEGRVFCDHDSFDDDYKAEMQAFLDRIDGKDTIGCTGEEGLRVLEICLKVREQAGL